VAAPVQLFLVSPILSVACLACFFSPFLAFSPWRQKLSQPQPRRSNPLQLSLPLSLSLSTPPTPALFVLLLAFCDWILRDRWHVLEHGLLSWACSSFFRGVLDSTNQPGAGRTKKGIRDKRIGVLIPVVDPDILLASVVTMLLALSVNSHIHITPYRLQVVLVRLVEPY
jgi:hypothetical protein